MRVKPNYKDEPFQDSVGFYYFGWRKEGMGYIDKSAIRKNIDWIGMYKIYVPQVWGIGNVSKDWINPFIGGINSCCSETYLVIGPFDEGVSEIVCNQKSTTV